MKPASGLWLGDAGLLWEALQRESERVGLALSAERWELFVAVHLPSPVRVIPSQMAITSPLRLMALLRALPDGLGRPQGTAALRAFHEAGFLAPFPRNTTGVFQLHDRVLDPETGRTRRLSLLVRGGYRHANVMPAHAWNAYGLLDNLRRVRVPSLRHAGETPLDHTAPKRLLRETLRQARRVPARSVLGDGHGLMALRHREATRWLLHELGMHSRDAIGKGCTLEAMDARWRRHWERAVNRELRFFEWLVDSHMLPGWAARGGMPTNMAALHRELEREKARMLATTREDTFDLAV